MQKIIVQVLVFVGIVLTFVLPLVQLSIGFHYVVKDGENATGQCPVAFDLPLLLAIGGIFALFFLGTAYGFLKIVSTVDKPNSDVAGKAPRILIGLVSFIFGSITVIFFILIQIRVYGAYAKNVQFTNRSATTYCQSGILHGALAIVILGYLNLLMIAGIFAYVLVHSPKKHAEMELTVPNQNTRF